MMISRDRHLIPYATTEAELFRGIGGFSKSAKLPSAKQHLGQLS